MNSTLYPLKGIVEKFGRNYFSDTIAYQIAYALYKGYDKIKIYGADMHTYGEYATEKGGIEYWLGRAESMGVEIVIPKDSSLLKTCNLMEYGMNPNIKLYTMDEHGVKHETKRIVKRQRRKPMGGTELIRCPL